MSRLSGKVALITGGGAGIGAAAARLFYAEGASVVVVERDPTRLSTNSKIVTVSADVADDTSAARAVEQALQAFGRLDVLVNNAAMRNYSAVAQATREEWMSVVSVNLIGAASFAKAALPALRKSGKGAIVNVSSTYAIAGRRGMAIYDATKAGLLSLTRTLAHEEASHGVRVNAICPGSTLTDFHIDRARAAGEGSREPEARARRHVAPRPLGHARGNRGPDPVARVRRGVVHHRCHIDGRRRTIHQISAARRAARPMGEPTAPRTIGGQSASEL